MGLLNRTALTGVSARGYSRRLATHPHVALGGRARPVTPRIGPVPARRGRVAEVEVWHVDLPTSCDVDHLLPLLDEREGSKARRFRFRPHYESYVRSHVALRLVLGDAVGTHPDKIRFDNRCARCGADHGKPTIAWPARTGIDFSLSHTTGVALVAVAWDRLVGIDVQHKRDDLNFEGIMATWFDEAEATKLAQQPSAEQADRFFRLWTRREACAKAVGLSIEHDLDPSMMAEVFGSTATPGPPPELAVRDLVIGPHHAAAICAGDVDWLVIDRHLSNARLGSTARSSQSSTQQPPRGAQPRDGRQRPDDF
jgi:4'-phosphopantetheinyl transferase